MYFSFEWKGAFKSFQNKRVSDHVPLIVCGVSRSETEILYVWSLISEINVLTLASHSRYEPDV